MSSNSAFLPKSLITFGIAIPLALLVGYFLATPTDLMSFGIIGLLFLVLCIPLLLRWHYPALIFAWNANMTVFFLPGQPSLWMLLAAGSLFFTGLACLIDKQVRFQNVPSISWPLLVLTLIVVVTAKLTGGIGLHSLGSGTYGGKKLFYILAAIVGYFAISSQPINPNKVFRYTGLYFLSGLTGVMSNLIYLAGPSFYLLYLFFPTDFAVGQAMEDFTGNAADVRLGRLPGVTAAAMAAFYYILARYGIRGVLQVTKPWRWLLLLLSVGLSLLGGFRSAVIIFALICAVQFYFEGLFRSRLVVPLILAVVLAGTLLTAFATRLPLSVQRSLSVLPIEIDTAARLNADASVEWRLQMWKLLLPQVRQYFFLGKGYALDPTDLYFATESIRRGLADDYEGAVVAGDYHNGPLSVIIPFGIFGLLAFIWFLAAGIRLLYQNYRFGDPALSKINTFLLSYFVARSIFYFVGFGALHSDMPMFLGALGFSVALNGGIRRQERSVVPAEAALLPDPATP